MEIDQDYTITSAMPAFYQSERSACMEPDGYYIFTRILIYLRLACFSRCIPLWLTCTKKGDYDVSMLMFCCEYFSSVINSLLYSCDDKLDLRRDGKIQIRLIRAKRHLCNCWLIWLGFFIFMSQLEYLLQGLVVALVCLFPLLQAIAA